MKHNDFELLYLIFEGNEVAREIMLEKYLPLIKSKVRILGIPFYDSEDFIQEGYEVLNKALVIYNTDSRKTFTRFFELLLIRRLGYLAKKYWRHKNTMVNDESVGYMTFRDDSCGTVLKVRDLINTSDFSQLEIKILELKFDFNLQPSEISKMLNTDIKKVYNGIQRGITKLRQSKSIF